MNTLAPISLMLHHEVRLNWRQMTSRLSHTKMVVTAVCLLVLMHLLSLPLLLIDDSMISVTRAELLTYATAAGAGAFMIMMPLALMGTVNLIYSRSDMDLLLSSPVPPKAIVIVRILTIALGLFATAGFFVLPSVNVIAAAGYPRALVAYVGLTCVALVATSVGVLLAQGVFRLLGARRTRLFAQIMAAILGVGFLMVCNLHNILPKDAANALTQYIASVMSQLPGVDSLFWLPARALIGEPLPFLAMVVLSAGIFVATTFGLANRLMANAVAASSVGSRAVKTKGGSRALRGDRGPMAVMRSKEWLLIRRDPALITQIVKQIMMMLPSILIVWKMSGSSYAWLALIFLCGQLAGLLTWLTMSTEDAPDLLETAPVGRSDLVSAKLQAALIPTALVMAAPLAAAWLMGPWIGFSILVCSIGCALVTSIYHMRNSKPAKRSDIARRGGANQLHGVFEMAIGLLWITVGALMVFFGWWGLLAVPVVAPGLYFLAR